MDVGYLGGTVHRLRITANVSSGTQGWDRLSKTSRWMFSSADKYRFFGYERGERGERREEGEETPASRSRSKPLSNLIKLLEFLPPTLAASYFICTSRSPPNGGLQLGLEKPYSTIYDCTNGTLPYLTLVLRIRTVDVLVVDRRTLPGYQET